MSYQTDRQWSDAYIPAIRQTVAPYLFDIAPDEEDMKNATDLMVFKAKDMRVAARLRRPGYASKYPDDFTIRAHRDNGAKTELAKMVEGFGDWMFYGHASSDGKSIDAWMLIDLDVWRAELIRRGYSDGWSGLATKKSNGDGTHFYAFNALSFPDNLLIARKCP